MSLHNKRRSKLKDQKGQTFIEFIFMLFILVMLSYTFLRGFNGGIATRWEALVQVIASPTDSNIELP